MFFGGAKSGTKKKRCSRAMVMHGSCKQTSGGLQKKDLMRKNGRIVSRAASAKAKERFNAKGKKAEARRALFKANKFKKGKK